MKTTLPTLILAAIVSLLLTQQSRGFDLFKELKKAKDNVDDTLTKAKTDVDREATNAKKKVDREATEAKINIDREATEAKQNIDRELTDARENLDRELTEAKTKIDARLTEIKAGSDRESETLWKNIVTEYNYFFGTACGDSSELKKLTRRLNQGEISRTEYKKQLETIGGETECGGGIEYDSTDGVAITDANGNRSLKPPSKQPDINLSYYFDDAQFTDSYSKYGSPELLIKSALYFRDQTIWPGEDQGFEIYPPNSTGEVRSDSAGQGYFGAKRSGGRWHLGIDYLSMAGSNVLSPVTGIVDRITDVYRNPVKNGPLKAIVIKNIQNGRYETKVLYVNPEVSISKGSHVTEGETVLGKTQSLLFIHKGAKDHIHVQIKGPGGIIVPLVRTGIDTVPDPEK